MSIPSPGKFAVSSLAVPVMLATITSATPSFRQIQTVQKEAVVIEARKDGARPPSRVNDEARAPTEFVETYRLASGQNLKRIASPRPQGFGVWYKRTGPGRGYIGDVPEFDAMVFQWSAGDQLRVSITMGGRPEGWTIRELPQLLNMGLQSYEIEGDQDLLNTQVAGDWIVREGVPAEHLAQPLEAILQRAVRLRITVALRRVEREVVVVRGRYHPAPLPGHVDGQIEVYARELAQDQGWGGGSGGFPAFLEHVAEWFGRPIFNEVESAPKRIEWRHNMRQASTDQARRGNDDETLVFKHLEEQTGLTFAREKRSVRILFVERPTAKK